MTRIKSRLSSIVAALVVAAVLASPAAARDYVSVNAAVHPASTAQDASGVSSSPAAIMGARDTVPPTAVLAEGGSSPGFDWDAALVGAGSMIALVILASGTYMLARRRRAPTVRSAGSV